jgi:hypothetical protein
MSPDSQTSLWNLINKPIVIWFLATVVVGLVSFGYDYVKTEREIAQSERQIDIEITSRLMHARIFYFPEAYAVSHVQALPDDGEAHHDDILQLAFGGFRMFRQALDAGTAYGAFPEFRERNLQSLIWELLTLRDDSSGEVKEALQAAITLSRQRIFWMNPQNFESEAVRVTDQTAKEAIVAELEEFERNYEKLRLARWDFGIPDETLTRYTPDLNLPELGE